jgi:3-oxoacyl-[acyl-carrier protein] reductase
VQFDLKGKTALVTGAASGIGLATATMLAGFGAKVAINHLADDDRGPEAVRELTARGLDVIGAPGNVAEAGGCEAMTLKAIGELGRLDLLVNNAGTPGVRAQIPAAELDKITEELWQTILQTNLVGAFRCAHAAAAALKAAHGSIVQVASVAGVGGGGSSLAYAASKAGLINLTRNLARGLGPEVRVNCVAPGAVDTAWQIKWTEAHLDAVTQAAALKRRCTAEDIAEVIVFLGCGAGMVTGQTLIVDGGMTL